jgi:hypothetical protein
LQALSECPKSQLGSSLSADIKVQQELMRHADIRTTMNLYTQANSDQKRQAQGKIVHAVLAGQSEDCSLVLPQASGTH